MTTKRYFLAGSGKMIECDRGGWVHILDYDVLAAQLAEAEYALAMLRRYSPSLHDDLTKEARLAMERAADRETRERPVMAITDFLDTKTSKVELAVTLRVLREFKACESQQEWLDISFAAWAKLEQLEEFLAHLIEGSPLKDDTIEYRATHGAEPRESGV